MSPYEAYTVSICISHITDVAGPRVLLSRLLIACSFSHTPFRGLCEEEFFQKAISVMAGMDGASVHRRNIARNKF